jgi:hypothetical protein
MIEVGDYEDGFDWEPDSPDTILPSRVISCKA